MKATLSRIVWRTLQSKIFDGVRPKICRTHVFLLEGKTKRSNFDLSTLVFAKREIAHYFSKLYSEKPEIRNLGTSTFDNIPFITASMRPDIVFVAASRILSEFLLSKTFLILPQINFSLDISDAWNSIYARMHRHKRKAIRRIEKLGYTYKITRESEKLRTFCDQMYRPRILHRHGKSAEVVSFAECERLFRSGGLLLVKLDGKSVSGAIYVHHGDELYIPMLGVEQMDNYFSKQVAALYFTILWARKQGYKKIDYGSCRPFLNDGIFRFKKEWGMKMKPVEGKDARIFAIKLCNFENQTIDFLLDNPFVFERGEHLKGFVILNSVKDSHSTYRVSGLSGLLVLSSIHNHPSFQFTKLHKLSLEGDSSHTPASLSPLLKIISEKGYEVHTLEF